MKKRIVSMILCFALLLTYTPMTVSATEETTTIYFENTANWSVVNAYGWDSDNSSAAYLGSWPGTAMTLVEDETSIYSIEVPAEVDNVIFNNGTVQTGDCAIPTDGTNLFTPGAVGEDGKYTGTWSAYGPTESDTARITDVTITVDGREYAGGDTATITFNSTVYFTVTGTNLDKLDSAADIFYVWGTVVTIASGEGTSEQIRVSVPASDFTILTNKFEVCYHPGGEGDLIKTGLYVQYDTQGMDPKITGVKLTVDGTEYTEGTAVVRPTSAVTITILGENLNQISGDQNLNGILALDLNNEAWVTSEDGSERSATYSGDLFRGFTAETEIEYANDSLNFTGSGVYVLYGEDGIYTFTFEDFDGTTIGSITQDFGTAVTAPENPIRSGYTFLGWVNDSGNTATIPSVMPATNMTFKATWEINRYTFTFDAMNDTEVYSITLNYGEALTPPADPTKAGCHFQYWAKKNGEEATIPGTMPAYDMELHAVWLEKDTANITDVNAQTFTWDDTSKEFAVSGTPEEGYSVSYFVDDVWASDAPSAAGTYDVKITRAEDDTYKAFEMIIEGGLVIAQRQEETPAAVFTSPDKLTGLEPGATYTITADGTTHEDSAYDDGSGQGLIYVYGKWCGKTVSIVKNARDENHLDSEAQELAIPERLTGKVTLDTDSGRYIVGETLKASVTDTNNTGTLSYQWYRIAETLAPIDGADNSSYTITEADVGYAILCFVSSDAHAGTLYSNIVSIKKAFAGGDITVSEYSGVYDGQSHSITVTAPEGATVYYGAGAEDCNSTDAPLYSDAGEHTVYYRVVKDGYESVRGSAVVSIAPKPVTITADSHEVCFGSKQPQLTYTVDGLIGNDTLTTAPALTTDANMHCAGTYHIIASGADAGSNYRITCVNGTLTVKNAPYVVIPTDPAYPPVVGDSENGKVTVSLRNPQKGDTVVITSAPDHGYAVDNVIVTDRNGSPVEVIDNGDGTYSFRQPAGKVHVDVTFREIDEDCLRDGACPLSGYTDLDKAAWYHDGIHYCIEHGLMQGVGNHQFSPNGTTTRAMIVTTLWRLEGSPAVNAAMDFADVPEGQWYSDAIRWAASEKIVEGYGNGKFGMNDAITREQLVTIMYRYAKYRGYDVSVGEDTNLLSYDDAFAVADWAIPAMQWSCGSGMIQGIADGNQMNLAPQGSATRAQAAAILQRYCENVAKN